MTYMEEVQKVDTIVCFADLLDQEGVAPVMDLIKHNYHETYLKMVSYFDGSHKAHKVAALLDKNFGEGSGYANPV